MVLPSDRWNEIKNKLESLPESTFEEVLDFIEFLELKEHLKESSVDGSSLRLQQESLRKIWEDEPDLYEL
ncbi:MAG: DUF2281 domain-containing protein [bacterium]